MKEQEIVKAILEWLTYKKIFHYRNNTGAMVSEYKGKKRFMRFGSLGSPDIIVFKKSDQGAIAIALEVKRDEKAKQTESQKQWQEDFETKANGKYLLVHSIAEIESALI